MKQFECFGLDTANQCLLRGGAPIDLAPKPFAVLRYLVENPGRLITHDELLDKLWPETFVQPQVLRTYMLELRKVLGDDAGQPRFIQTLPKRGYRFVAEVTERGAGESARPGLAHTVAGTPAQDSRRGPVVGRAAELARLGALFNQAERGERQIVFVSGEAGIGKTTVVDAFCDQLVLSHGVRVARGGCVQGIGGKEEYYPVVEALRALCAGPDGEAACRVLSRMAPAWLSFGREPAGGEAEEVRTDARQERTLGDLCSALEAMAAENPLALVFEDLHWADSSTLHLISALARRRAQARLMVVTTDCPRHGSSEDPLKGLKHDLLMRRLCVEMVVAPLPRTAVLQLIARELDQQALPTGLADFVIQRSEGNPLFVIAVVEHLIAEQVLVRRAGAAWEQDAPFPEMEAGVPNPLMRMIELEIEHLSEDEQRMLEAASLMNVAFPAWAVAAALEKDAVEVEEACDSLARRLHYVVRAGRDELPDGSNSAFYCFAHGIYREVLYQRQSSARRARRHVRIAERLGELFAGREASVARERAMHYEAAGDMARAARVLEDAENDVAEAGVC
jgi:predicted ATPase/DNA-binding winged helix-turn-helix (wHTH) protein